MNTLGEENIMLEYISSYLHWICASHENTLIEQLLAEDKLDKYRMC